MSETTKEFAARLEQALEGNPHTPTAQYGRLTWLQRELEARAGLKVSVNTVHKWLHGMSRPRPDNIRQLAQVLKVDEVWLSLGQKPSPNVEPTALTLGRANGAVLTIAGLIEQEGGRVTFPPEGTSIPHMSVNIGTARVGLVVIVPQRVGEKVTFMVPEPVKNHRVVGVVTAPGGKTGHTAILDIYDLTDHPKQEFGGFSVIQLEAGVKGTIQVPGTTEPLKALASILHMAPQLVG